VTILDSQGIGVKGKKMTYEFEQDSEQNSPKVLTLEQPDYGSADSTCQRNKLLML
jgi:hypothetical protein